MDVKETDLYSESVRIESKVLYLDLRLNTRGQYLKISETTGKRPRSTVLVPAPALAWLDALLSYFIHEAAAGRRPDSKELAAENKVFHLSVSSNERGMFLRVSENAASNATGRRTLIIPSGGPELGGWAVLRDCVRRITSMAADAEPGLQTGPQPQPLPQPQQGQAELPSYRASAPAAVVGPGQGQASLSSGPQGTPVLACAGKRVFFDVGATQRGRFLRITEVANQDRTSIVIPSMAVPQFQEAVATCARMLREREQQQPQPAAPQPQQQQQQQQLAPRQPQGLHPQHWEAAPSEPQEAHGAPA